MLHGLVEMQAAEFDSQMKGCRVGSTYCRAIATL